jgi:hypothetical protein
VTLPFTAIVVGLLTREFFPRTSPWLAAALAITAPTVLWEATTAYVDLALALHLGVAVLALARIRHARDWPWIVTAGLQFGFACATKHLGLVALASALLVFAGCRLGRLPLGSLGRVVATVLLLAVAVPAPWYARAWRASGNPFFPELYGVFGASPAERWDDRNEEALRRFKDRFGRPRTAGNLATLPWDMTMHGARYGGTLGPMLLIWVPGLLLAVRGNRTARWIAAGGALYFAVWASPLSSYQVRFLVPWWVVLAPLVAAAAQGTAKGVVAAWPRARAVVPIGLVALLAANLPPLTPLHEGDRRGWSGWLTHVLHRPPAGVVLGAVSEDAWLRGTVRSFAAWRWIDAHTPPTARVLTFAGGDHLYAHRPRLWSESVLARPATWGAEQGDLEATRGELRHLGITHVLAPAARHRTPEQARLDVLQPEMAHRYFDVAFEDYWTVVYAVRPASSASPREIDQRYGR